MALFSERVQKCARKVLDTADIVREAMLLQQSVSGTVMSVGRDVGGKCYVSRKLVIRGYLEENLSLARSGFLGFPHSEWFFFRVVLRFHQ
jgi:hypothetical protein